MATIQELFEKQRMIQDVLGLIVKDDPMQFYHAMNGVIMEAAEAMQEDTRWKSIAFNKPGYKMNIDKEKKVKEMGDVLLNLLIACMYSEVTLDELFNAAESQADDKYRRFSGG